MATPRLLLPLLHGFDCQMQGAQHVCDATMALWLVPEHMYRLRRPVQGQHSAVLALAEGVPWPQTVFRRGSSRVTKVSLTSHFRLRLLGAQLQATQAGSTQSHGGCDAGGPCSASTDGHLQGEEALLGLLADWLSPQGASLLRSGRPAVAVGRTERAVQGALAFLSRRATYNDSLADIAAGAHCSPLHLARSFKLRTGVTLHAHRTQLRMAQALHRVAGGENDLCALALDLGFASHSHLSSVFRQSFGHSPSHMRTILAAPVG